MKQTRHYWPDSLLGSTRLLRGHVIGIDSAPVTDASVTVLGHPELGRGFRKYLLGLEVTAGAAAGARRGATGNGGAVAGDEASPRRAVARRKRPIRKGQAVLRKSP